MSGKPIPLLSRWERHVVTGDRDACWEWTGARSPKGYGILGNWTRQPCGRQAHRVAYHLFVGPLSPDLVIDHICHNPPCVNPSHLRQVTGGENNFYRKGPNAVGTSGYRGVSYHRPSHSWMAYANRYYVRHVAGYFSTPEEANEAAIALRLRLFTHNDADRAA